MIRDLFSILHGADRRTLVSAVVWMSVDALLQGVCVCLLVPTLSDLLRGDLSGAGRWLLIAAVVGAAAMVAHHVQAMKCFELALTLMTTLRERLGEHVVRLPLGWFDGRHAAQLSKVGSSGVMSASQSVAHLLQPLVMGLAVPAVITAYLLVEEVRLGLVALCAAPVLWACFRLAATLLAKSDTMTHEHIVEANRSVLEFARCQPVLRAFGRTGERGYRPLEDALDRRREAARKQLWMTIPGMIVTGLTLQAVFSVTIVVGIDLAVDDRIEPVVLVALLALMARFIAPLSLVSELSGGVRMARNDLTRIREVLATEGLSDPPRAHDREPAPGTVELDRVDFGYDGVAGSTLRDLSVRAEPRTITAVVGPSGSGKSTVLRLIGRFWDVGDGAVRVGGRDVRDIDTETLMGQLSFVFQDVYLFDDTLRANVLLGRPQASDDEVDHAARVTGLDDVVGRLPNGWDTVVGEGGARLSGGERQRVAVARALLKQAPIVLLDEATAALDPANEHLVRAAVQELARDATVIVVAHTPAMIGIADQVVVLDDGRVVETGTLNDLRAAGGLFSRLFAERERASTWRLTSGPVSGP